MSQESVKRRRRLACLAMYRVNKNTLIHFICTSEYIYLKIYNEPNTLIGCYKCRHCILKINVKGGETKYFIVHVPPSGRYMYKRKREAHNWIPGESCGNIYYVRSRSIELLDLSDRLNTSLVIMKKVIFNCSKYGM